MIVDEKSLRILSSSCKVYDILEEGVTVVESVTKKRQPLPELDSIYFLAPDEQSVEALCQDFAKQPQYNSVYLFFTSPLGPESRILHTIAACSGLLARLKTLVEFNLSFIAYEKRVFHLDMPDLLPALCMKQQTELLELVADDLLTVCASFGDRPTIRFHHNNLRYTERLASLVHQKLSKLDVAGMTRNKSILLILDRSIDLPTLFLHEYTYQAAVYDLLNVPVCSPAQLRGIISSTNPEDGPLTDDAIQYPVVTGDGKSERRTALLNESDEVFVRYRHHHMMSALKKVPQDITKFLNDNAAAKLTKRKDMSNEELQRAIRDIPEYQEMLSKYSLHHSISQRCIREMNRLGLPKAGPLEQDLSTGVDGTGKELSAKKNLAALGGLLADPSIGIEEKLRLLLLYFSVTDGVKDDDRRKMMEAAQLPLDFQQCVQTFSSLGLENANADPNVPPPPSHVPKLQRDKERRLYFVNRAKTVEVALSRFQPFVKDIIEKAIQGGLHGGKFPYVAAPETRASVGWETNEKTAFAHVRARDKEWDFTSDTGAEPGPSDCPKEPGQANEGAAIPFFRNQEKPAIIVFIVGGVTMAEMRSAYEVSKQTGTEVFLGGTSIVTPKTFLQMLKRHAVAPAPFWQPAM